MDPITMMLGGLGSIFGGFGANNQLNNARDSIKNMAAYNPYSSQGSFGNFNFSGGQGMVGDSMQQSGYRSALAPGIGFLSQGGLFNDPNMQAAFANNDIAGADQMQQQMIAGIPQQQGDFGQLGMLQQLAQHYGGNAQGPMQDQSGGLMSGLWQMAQQNQQAAGDMNTLQSQELNTMRQAAAPELARQQQAMEKSLFAKGMLGGNSTQTGEAYRGLMEAQGAQDLGFQQNAFNRAAQRSSLLSNLGNAQMGQAGNLLGQNMQNQQFQGQMANVLGNSANQWQNQQFQNQLASSQMGLSAGQNRINSMQSLFGLGNDSYLGSFGAANQGINSLMGIDSLQSSTLLGLLNAEANRIGATGDHARSIGQIGGQKSGLVGGIIKGLFSDRRLKKNIKLVGTDEAGINWYTWEWNSQAKLVGADKMGQFGVIAQEVKEQVPEAVFTDPSGFLKVDYDRLGAQ